MTLTTDELAQFTGSENWYRHALVRTITYTDGVKYLAARAVAYWLLDEIALSQSLKAVKAETFQVWTLKLDAKGNSASLTCDNGDKKVVYTKRIKFTDFPLPEIKLYCTDGVILLPSEY